MKILLVEDKIEMQKSTIIALLSLAIGICTGSELYQPFAIAVIGGFLIAMPLLLIVLPSCCIILIMKIRSNFKPR